VQPETMYARLGRDRIAYQVLGEGPPDLVMTTGSHVDMAWEDPGIALFLGTLVMPLRAVERPSRVEVGGPAHELLTVHPASPGAGPAAASPFGPLTGASGATPIQDIAALTLVGDLGDLRLAQHSSACTPRLPGSSKASRSCVLRRAGGWR